MISYRFNAHTKEIDAEIQNLFRKSVPRNWKKVTGPADVEMLMAIPITPLVSNPRVKLLNVISGPSKHVLTVKSRLYERFNNYAWVPDSRVFMNTDEPPTIRSLKILKPTEGYRGMGISRVTSKAEIKAGVEKYPEYKEWTLQTYIHPATYKGHKFHLRVYLLVNTQGNKLRNIWLAKKNFLVQAQKPYEKGDYENVLIHDSHMKHGHLFIFPDDKPDDWTDADIRKAQKGIMKIFRDIIEVEHDFRSDWKSQNGFQVFGVDIMFQEKTNKPFILEFNTKAELGLKEILLFYPSFYQHGVGDLFGIDFLHGSPDLFERVM
jgi:Tubulin-tyrosine ligase family